MSRWTDVPRRRSFAPSMDAAWWSSAFHSRRWLARTRVSRRRILTVTRFLRASRERSRADRFVFGGSDRFDSLVIEETNGRVISRSGPEGVHSVAVFDLGLRIRDQGRGRRNARAYQRCCACSGCSARCPSLSPKLAEYARARIRNARREVVGELLPAVREGL